MYKVSVVGIDNSGKTSVVDSLGHTVGLSTIHLTSFDHCDSKFAGSLGKLFTKITKFSENHNISILAGFMYLLYLFPYSIEERIKKSSTLLVSDRDPIIDTLCYSSCYLSDDLSVTLRPYLRHFLEYVFPYPDSFFYLYVSPDVSIRRISANKQLHEEIHFLDTLTDLFDEEMFRARKKGVLITRFNTDTKSLEEVIEEVKYVLMSRF